MQFGPESANILLRRTVVAVVISKFDIVKKDLILSSIYLIDYEIVNVSMFLILERSPDDSALFYALDKNKKFDISTRILFR